MRLHHKTPTLTLIDPRGLTIRSVDYWRAVEDVPTQARINRTLHNAAGLAVKQWDPRLWLLQEQNPRAPANSTTVYSLSGLAVGSLRVDAGLQISLFGLANEILQGWDSRDVRREVEYDNLLRPVAVFEHLVTEPRWCAERMEYGRPDQGGAGRNHYGRLIRQDGPGATVLFESYAITGECTKHVQHFTLEAVAPDWPESIVERQKWLEPGEGAISAWLYGARGDVLETVDAGKNIQAFGFTLDGQLQHSALSLAGKPAWQLLVSGIEYNAAGRVLCEVAGNGVQTTLTYCPETGRLLERRAHSEHTGLQQHLFYAYDRMGNVLSIEDKALPVRYFNNQRIEPLSRFIYDSLYQLIEASGWEAGAANQGPESVGRNDPAALSNYHQTYCYDAGGNLLKLTHVGAQSPGRELKAARYSNRCLPWRNGVPPTEDDIDAAFDANGNLLMLDQGRFTTWNLRNQLQSVSPVVRNGGINDREFYLYDGGGQRVRKLRTSQTKSRSLVAEVRYLQGLELRTDSGTAQVLHVVTAQAGLNTVRVLHWESDPPSGVNDQYRYNLVDHLNSCTLELADDARVISREMFYPFGETAWFAGMSLIGVDYKTIRYSGKERDATGLYYYGLRFYIPWLQRWANPDPTGPVDGWNLYWMTRNNPVNFVDDGGAISLKEQPNGLWEPVIAQGKTREVPGAKPVDAGKPLFMVPFTGQPTDIRSALSVPEFGQVSVNTDLLMSTKVAYSPQVRSQLVQQAGGSGFIFSMLRMTYFGAARGEFNALKVVDIAGGEIPQQFSAVSGYWAPQGGYVDIPTHPSGSDPEFVFTPGFSGCSLTVNQLNDNVLRVRHVEGGKEDAQYNELSAAEHGLGLSAAMQFPDYGFDVDEKNEVITQTTGFAFMRYDQKIQAWNIHYQTLQGAVGIATYSTAKRSFFRGGKSTVNVFENTKVRNTMSKKVFTAKR
ncbi:MULTISPECIES: RHS repeat-associated core domain-containing protein [unclassified Pseudomonas]|uniref:RHS repeat-associated core domain-containing protein n=1 Tax=unclassified Pseudomonas TaxID=196821 RepID=UPI002AC8F99D|nr:MULTISPECIES: RHS repeat-associated core domain-containing protein [unclassified Pseudomonas]MEB0044336.1 RHS repeat-associated core domain-containing protein [Pseudomonas sp. Dout3]MEB0094727.1 RHS repeat-associated core domain-containing protein [Pseudomonas sp. DC1.2]WPX59907.1 RHS repeat-associated core domain-containing protein [Pseudomonas sp. DC1.2]